ncbi:DUF3499 domain-containing protein [Tomitella fengzijianii]|uniref:DUF3499 domain-containing protein n=2 Tax=Tomitella fengzijianii TaxID=2597660 RepID=A0A516X131_9ACTN|nr:DUF3499 domain-containing protein [Tomitella fengzijianii]
MLRKCCRPGCNNSAVATLTFVYSDSTAVVGPLATSAEPHSWDLCESHAVRITAPRNWDLVRHEGRFAPGEPDEDDLTALAEAVREAGRGERRRSAAADGPARGADTPSGPPSPITRTGRRGHLRVLPDPES